MLERASLTIDFCIKSITEKLERSILLDSFWSIVVDFNNSGRTYKQCDEAPSHNLRTAYAHVQPTIGVFQRPVWTTYMYNDSTITRNIELLNSTWLIFGLIDLTELWICVLCRHPSPRAARKSFNTHLLSPYQKILLWKCVCFRKEYGGVSKFSYEDFDIKDKLKIQFLELGLLHVSICLVSF